jgi:hypothetical protein
MSTKAVVPLEEVNVDEEHRRWGLVLLAFRTGALRL